MVWNLDNYSTTCIHESRKQQLWWSQEVDSFLYLAESKILSSKVKYEIKTDISTGDLNHSLSRPITLSQESKTELRLV